MAATATAFCAPWGSGAAAVWQVPGGAAGAARGAEAGLRGKVGAAGAPPAGGGGGAARATPAPLSSSPGRVDGVLGRAAGSAPVPGWPLAPRESGGGGEGWSGWRSWSG